MGKYSLDDISDEQNNGLKYTYNAIKDTNNALKYTYNAIKDTNNATKDTNNALKYIDFGVFLISVVLSSMEKMSLFVYNDAKDASFLDALIASLRYNQLTNNPVCAI